MTLAITLTFAAAAGAIEIAAEGKSRCAIVIAVDATPAERTAASELAAYLQKSTAARFEVRSENDASADEPQILVGPSARARSLAPDVDFSALGTEGIVIKTIGPHLLLAGGRPRGTLNAVNTFLEDAVGVRWWTAVEETVPTHSTLAVQELNVTYVPRFWYREAFYREPMADPRFAMRLKLNGHFTVIPEELGGHWPILGWSHTLYALLPPDQYFASHPEWYSQQGQTRSFHNGQLCWTNPQMRDELVTNALKWIAANPAARIISISQNDCIGNCQCKDCAAIDAAEGTPAGSMLFGVNAVAEAIGKLHPHLLVETLAYQHTRRPPKTLKPAANVLVRFCPIEADGVHPLAGPCNRAFAEDLKGWARITPNLHVWNYVTNFNFFLVPHPNLGALGPDLRLFHDNNISGLFQQGDDQNGAGDLLALRVWLLARLMWDPSRDQQQLLDEFLSGYYGPAGPHLKRYVDVTGAPAKDDNFHAGCFNQNLGYLTDAMLRQCRDAFDAAEESVRTSPRLLARVKRERLVLEHLELQRHGFPQPAGANASAAIKLAVRQYEVRAGNWAAAAIQAGVKYPGNYSAQPFESYAAQLITRGRALLPAKSP